MTQNKTDVEAIKAEADAIAKGVAMLPVTMYKVADLKEYEKNSKVHDKSHIARLSAHIKAEGLQESLLIEPDGTIVAGHGRRLSVKELGWEEVPVRIMHGYTKAQCMIHRVSSNLTVSTKYDSTKQAEELSDIQAQYEAEGLSIDELATLTGYSERDIEVLSEDITAIADLDDLSFDEPLEPALQESKEPVKEEPEQVQKMTSLVKLLGFNEVTPEIAKSVRKFLAIADIDSPETLEDFCKGYLQAVEGDND